MCVMKALIKLSLVSFGNLDPHHRTNKLRYLNVDEMILSSSFAIIGNIGCAYQSKGGRGGYSHRTKKGT